MAALPAYLRRRILHFRSLTALLPAIFTGPSLVTADRIMRGYDLSDAWFQIGLFLAFCYSVPFASCGLVAAMWQE